METVATSGHGHKPDPATDAQQRCREALDGTVALLEEAHQLLAELDQTVRDLVEATEEMSR